MNLVCLLLTCLTLSVSAYSDHGITASGAWTRQGIAACGSVFPFGTVFVVQSKAYVCMDRGSLVTDGHLDLFMDSEEAAWEWGRKNVTVGVWR